MANQILELWSFLSKKRHRQFWLVVCVMLFASVAEIFSLGAVLPFLGAITSPEMVFQHPYMQSFVKVFNIESSDQIIFPISLIFILCALFAGAIRILLVYIMTRFSFATGADLSVDIYRRTLYKSYEEHKDSNSSEVINGIMTKTNTVIGGIIIPALNAMSSIVLLISLLLTLLLINPTITLLTFGIFFALYSIIFVFMKKRLHDNGVHIAQQTNNMLRSLQEGLGGIRDVLIDGTQKFYIDIYRSADSQFRQASSMNIVITSSPRFAMEAIGMAVIACLAYVMFQQSEATTIPLLGALALGAQRMLPVLQNLYASYGTITGGEASFQDVLDLLRTPLPPHANQSQEDLLPFNKNIKLDAISYRYKSNTPYVIKDINLIINKGSCVGFIGETGCGKSTILDIIMGLLSLSEGKLIVDDQTITKENVREWQGHIAHVPQTIYLSDNTIKENIAFGIPEEDIDEARLIKAAKKAKIHETINKLDAKYDTIVGEGGSRLSGGQRQRIGIARALYKGSSVLIFDEATSALDNKTESSIIEEVSRLGNDITVLIIAHRLSTLKECDHIYELSESCLIEKGRSEFNHS